MVWKGVLDGPARCPFRRLAANAPVAATFVALERCPSLSWQIVFLSVHFAGALFMEKLLENTNAANALVLPGGYRFGAGHQRVRLQAKEIREDSIPPEPRL